MKQTLIRARPAQSRPFNLQTIDPYLGTQWLYPTRSSGRLPVNERTVSGLVGAWASVRKIASAVAQMMSDADAFASDERTEIDPTPNVLSMPNVSYDPYTFWSECVSTALMRGNWLGLKCDYDPVTGYPRQVLPVPIDACTAYWDQDGYLVYQIGGVDFTPDEVVHVRIGLTIPGQPFAIGAVEAHRRGWAGKLDQENMSNDVWTNGAIPSGVVQLPVAQPSREQVDTVKQSWLGAFAGQRTVAVTGNAMTYTPINWSAADAQFLQSRQFTIAECALMFGLRPEDLGAAFGHASGALTYGNRTDDALQRIVDAYVPVMLPLEQAWSRLLPGKNFVRGNVEALLRSTTKERYELHQLAQQIGLETTDESRAIEGLPPAPKATTPQPPAPIQPASPEGTPVPEPLTMQMSPPQTQGVAA